MKIPPMLERIANSGFDPVKLHSKTACVFGVGGLGTIVAETLVRVGIGKLILVDRDVVGPENLNRLGYTPEDIGKPKVVALSNKLAALARALGEDFKVDIVSYHADVIAWDKLPSVVEECDIIFTCFDNLEARLEVNYYAVELNKLLVDAGTSDNGLRGRVIVVKPYITPCLGCYFDEEALYSRDIEEEINAPCNASLPTTMAIVASLQVDQGLRLLLNMENVYARININLDDDISVTKFSDLKPRKNCRYCGVKNE